MSSALGIPPARSTPAELLPYILQAVNQILMAPEELSYVKTMNVYTSVYNYVSSSSLDGIMLWLSESCASAAYTCIPTSGPGQRV